jgi:hypothetical protein
MVKPRERNTRFVDAVMTVPKVKREDLVTLSAAWHALTCYGLNVL